MTYHQRQMKGTTLAFLSGSMFGLLGYLGTQLIHDTFAIENMLFWRFFVAFLWILASISLTDKNQLKKSWHEDGIIRIFMLGAISYSASSLFYFYSAGLIGTGPAMVIFYSFPGFVALFGLIAGTWQFNKIAFAALFSVMLGLILMKGTGKESMDIMGILFGLIASLSYAGYVYGSQHTLKNLNPSYLTMLVCLGNTLLFFILSFVNHSFKLPMSLSDWFYICAIGLVATALPIQLLLEALKYISPLKASVISVVEPVMTVIIGLLFLHESVSFIQSFGIIVVLIGALLIQFERANEETPHAVSLK